MSGQLSLEPPAGLRRMVVVQADTGCWLWQGRVTDTGYAQMGSSRAHRVVFEVLVAPLAIDMTVDHLCHNADPVCPGGVTCLHRRCVNPRHLAEASRGDNKRRAEHRFRGGRIPATHCPRGHEMSGDNVHLYVWRERVMRKCRACMAMRYQQRMAAKAS